MKDTGQAAAFVIMLSLVSAAPAACFSDRSGAGVSYASLEVLGR